MSFLGIDLGATFIKGAILDRAARELRATRRLPFPPFSAEPRVREVDPGLILRSVRELLSSLLAECTVCEGLLVTGQMHGLILVDASGQPLSRYISWQDQRALLPDSTGEAVFSRVGGVFDLAVRRDTGNEFRPSSPICSLKALEERGRVPAGAIPCSLVDFVIANLRGKEPVSDTTNASGFGVLDVARGAWHRDVIDALDLSQLRWPEIVEPGVSLGDATIAGRRVPIFSGIGDHQAALLGTRLATDELSLNIATGSQVSRVRDEPVSGDFQTRPYTRGRWLNTITHLPAGRALNRLVALTAPGENADAAWERIMEEVMAVPATDLSVNLCFFETSIGNRGSIENLHEDNMSRAHLFRAAFESMCRNYEAAATRIWPERGWERVVFSGGLANKIGALRAIAASVLGGSQRRCDSAEDTLEGLLALATNAP